MWIYIAHRRGTSNGLQVNSNKTVRTLNDNHTVILTVSLRVVSILTIDPVTYTSLREMLNRIICPPSGCCSWNEMQWNMKVHWFKVRLKTDWEPAQSNTPCKQIQPLRSTQFEVRCAQVWQCNDIMSVSHTTVRSFIQHDTMRRD